MFRGYEILAALYPAFINRHDVRMIEGRSGAGLLLKAAQPLLIVGVLGGERLEGNLPAELRIFGKKHFSHSTLAERLNHGIAFGRLKLAAFSRRLTYFAVRLLQFGSLGH